ncbi:unnamed protein product [Echinostoma caproni]|uniref:SNF7 family protein n=1 Tax=Echinostoma caproni TaxID=27848 RepID=A0A183AS19_9TREM|nr:unnamed protein product [Echinostoma caproni]
MYIHLTHWDWNTGAIGIRSSSVREAKSLLQRTKALEKSLATRQTHLHNLEAMQLQIDSASDNQSVLRALADSGRALQQTTGGSEGLAKIEDTMHDIADTVQDTNEVSDMMSSFGRTSFVTDEDELENELKDLLTPEPESNKPKPATKTPAQIADEELEAELASLNDYRLRKAVPPIELDDQHIMWRIHVHAFPGSL